MIRSNTSFLPNLVPGDGGSRIEARLNKTWVPHYFCYKKSDWFELWLNVHYLAPEAIDCWADNMRLRLAQARLGCVL